MDVDELRPVADSLADSLGSPRTCCCCSCWNTANNVENNRTDLQDLSQKSQHGSANASSKKTQNVVLALWRLGGLGLGAGGWRWRPICSPSRLAALSPSPARATLGCPASLFRSSAKNAILWFFHRGKFWSSWDKAGLPARWNLASACLLVLTGLEARQSAGAAAQRLVNWMAFLFPLRPSNTFRYIHQFNPNLVNILFSVLDADVLTWPWWCQRASAIMDVDMQTRFTFLRQRSETAAQRSFTFGVTATRQVIVPARLIKGSTGWFLVWLFLRNQII